MPDFTVYTLEESEITISGGGQLSGINQGDGSHLVGLTITLDSNNFVPVTITDNDSSFADNDNSQTLTNAIVYDGTSHAAGRVVEAEYTITVSTPAPDSQTYTLIAFNIREVGGSPAYGTVEGLAFLDAFPPVGVPLTVTGASEGPRGSTTPFVDYFTPPCFAAGTRLATEHGETLVEDLSVGDRVKTLDHGLQPVRWIGRVHFSWHDMANEPALAPIRIAQAGNEVTVSPQHRILVQGWAAELMCGEDVLVAAKHLADAGRAQIIMPKEGVTYFHVLLDGHQIVYSNGILTESFYPGVEALKTLPALSAEFARFFPDLSVGDVVVPTARRCATRHEGRVLATAF